MKLHQILSPSFRSILAQLQQEPFTLYHPASMVQRSSSICSQFCQALVGCGYLSFEQMLHAAYRYRLGWVSALLNQRYHLPKTEHESFHCLFGLHLIRGCGDAVAIVEAEKTAVILSEHYPQYIWLAAGGLYELTRRRRR